MSKYGESPQQQKGTAWRLSCWFPSKPTLRREPSSFPFDRPQEGHPQEKHTRTHIKNSRSALPRPVWPSTPRISAGPRTFFSLQTLAVACSSGLLKHSKLNLRRPLLEAPPPKATFRLSDSASYLVHLKISTNWRRGGPNRSGYHNKKQRWAGVFNPSNLSSGLRVGCFPFGCLAKGLRPGSWLEPTD